METLADDIYAGLAGSTPYAVAFTMDGTSEIYSPHLYARYLRKTKGGLYVYSRVTSVNPNLYTVTRNVGYKNYHDITVYVDETRELFETALEKFNQQDCGPNDVMTIRFREKNYYIAHANLFTVDPEHLLGNMGASVVNDKGPIPFRDQLLVTRGRPNVFTGVQVPAESLTGLFAGLELSGWKSDRLIQLPPLERLKQDKEHISCSAAIATKDLDLPNGMRLVVKHPTSHILYENGELRVAGALITSDLNCIKRAVKAMNDNDRHKWKIILSLHDVTLD